MAVTAQIGIEAETPDNENSNMRQKLTQKTANLRTKILDFGGFDSRFKGVEFLGP